MRQGRKFFLAALVFVSAASTIFYQFVWTSRMSELAVIHEKTSELSRDASEAKDFLRLHPDLEKYRSSMRKRIDHSGRLLPEKISTENFLDEIEAFSRRAGVSLTGIVPLPAEKSEGLALQRVKISVRGTYFELLDFLYVLEQGGRFTSVEEVRGRADDDGIFSGEIDAVIYAKGL